MGQAHYFNNMVDLHDQRSVVITAPRQLRPLRLDGLQVRLDVLNNHPPQEGFKFTTLRFESELADRYATHTPIILLYYIIL